MEREDELERLKGDKKIPLHILMKRVLAYVRPELASLRAGSVKDEKSAFE